MSKYSNQCLSLLCPLRMTKEILSDFLAVQTGQGGQKTLSKCPVSSYPLTGPWFYHQTEAISRAGQWLAQGQMPADAFVCYLLKGTYYSNSFIKFTNVDSHAIVRNNAEKFCIPFNQFPSITSCKTIVQYDIEDTAIVTIHQPSSDFPNFQCTQWCVCIPHNSVMRHYRVMYPPL